MLLFHLLGSGYCCWTISWAGLRVAVPPAGKRVLLLVYLLGVYVFVALLPGGQNWCCFSIRGAPIRGILRHPGHGGLLSEEWYGSVGLGVTCGRGLPGSA